MFSLAQQNMEWIGLARWVPVLPAAAVVVCGLLGCFRSLRKFAAVVTIAAVGGAFVLSWMVFKGVGDPGQVTGPVVVSFYEWVGVEGFSAAAGFYIDPLTCVMLLVVTGIGTLITIYAAGYMAGDAGYFRFFAYIALFIFAMCCLVLADNLLLLYLGWEGVGLSSYLLIGYYYRKPSAVAAAKKAFIVNRIGDFGFAVGLLLTFKIFGSLQYDVIFPVAKALHGEASLIDKLSPAGWEAYRQASMAGYDWRLVIPYLLMLGALGKSAQLPLHVWLPDAMEGPTPVSALIHAATMVTAGVYMIARLMPIFELSPHALEVVAIIGCGTAVFAALVALCQYDIKRVWAYSTISQLGFMFLGVGVASTAGGIFHLFTHAFFKALLFLTAGSVMHALAGQLDLRKMSGMIRPMPVTGVLMLVGCLALAGVPLTSGYYSKDMILAEAYLHQSRWWGGLGGALAVAGMATAFVTAFYTFRLWFRVFMGPTKYEMGREHHGYPVDHPLDDKAEAHEVSWLMNGPLVLLGVGALAAGYFGKGWMEGMVAHSSAQPGMKPDMPTSQEIEDAHHMVSMLAGGGAVLAIGLAAYFHWLHRAAAERVAQVFWPVVGLLNRKFYVDELYWYGLVIPLRGLGHAAAAVDRVLIDGAVDLTGYLPKLGGAVQRPLQRGVLQGYAMTMTWGLVVVVAVVAYLALR